MREDSETVKEPGRSIASFAPWCQSHSRWFAEVAISIGAVSFCCVTVSNLPLHIWLCYGNQRHRAIVDFKFFICVPHHGIWGKNRKWYSKQGELELSFKVDSPGTSSSHWLPFDDFVTVFVSGLLSLPSQQYCNEVVLSRDIDRLSFVSFGAALSFSPFFACLFLKSLTLCSENVASILGLLLDHSHESSLPAVANVPPSGLPLVDSCSELEASLSTVTNVSSSGLPLVD